MNEVQIYGILERPRALVSTARDLSEEIAEKRQRWLCGSPILSDMPKSRTNSTRDLSDWAADAEPLLRAHKRVAQAYSDAYSDAVDLIETVPSARARAAMRLYYLRGMSRGEIARHTGVKYHAVYQLIARAVRGIAD